MKNAALSEVFNELADVMEILGEDPFRVNSYRRVARTIGQMPLDVEILLATGQLAKQPGMGPSSLAKIEEFIKTGVIGVHQECLKKIPADLPTLLTIPGMGPKIVKAVYEKLGVRNGADLRTAIENGSLAALPGFGNKKAAAILKGITFMETSSGRIRLDQAIEVADRVIGFLRGVDGVETVVEAGSLRRRTETVGSVDILVVPKKETVNSEKIIQAFTSAEWVDHVLVSGATEGSAVVDGLNYRVQVDVRIVARESFGSAIQYFTGSEPHTVHLRQIASDANMTLNEHGLFKEDKLIAGATEEDIYRMLGLDFIAPVLREDRGEIEAAEMHRLPEMIRIEDIHGDFHVHTTASDGRCEIGELAELAGELGYEYLCITDHSKSSGIANGLTEKQLVDQIMEIRRLNDRIQGVTVLAGSEVDILSDGSLDFEDALLVELDFVVASLHSGLGGPREKVTRRLLRAMENPYVNCIGHPTGRRIGQREPMYLDMAAVIQQAGRTHTALEINANPYRLDLKDIHCRMAVDAGARLAIGTDAHSIDGLGLMGFGIATACRGWATKKDILNSFPVREIISWVKKKRP